MIISRQLEPATKRALPIRRIANLQDVVPSDRRSKRKSVRTMTEGSRVPATKGPKN